MLVRMDEHIPDVLSDFQNSKRYWTHLRGRSTNWYKRQWCEFNMGIPMREEVWRWDANYMNSTSIQMRNYLIKMRFLYPGFYFMNYKTFQIIMHIDHDRLLHLSPQTFSRWIADLCWKIIPRSLDFVHNN